MLLLLLILVIVGTGLGLAVKTPVYPVQIRSVVSKMTAACQKALEERCSRVEVELPPAVDWGVEMKKQSSSGAPSGTTGNAEKIKKSNREAARLFTEMFSMLQTTTVVLFPTELEALEARSAWSSFKGQVLSLEASSKPAKGYSKLRSRRFTAEEQEAVLLSSDGVYIPDGCEVLIVAGPRAKDYKQLRKICLERLTDETCVINLNGRFEAVRASEGGPRGAEGAEEDKHKWYEDTFQNVFHYSPPALSDKALGARELLLYHEGPGAKWLLGEKVKKEGGVLGAIAKALENPFETRGTWDAKPTAEEMAQALAITVA
jgi:hypothetical protein